MWILKKQFRFEAAHHLPRHDGLCAHPHGHSYLLVVECCGALLQENGSSSGMVIDYHMISAAVHPLLVGFLDHCDLNASLGIPHTTAEAIAQWVYAALLPALPSLVAITIGETATTECRYAPVPH